MTGGGSGDAEPWADSAPGLWGCDFSFASWGWNEFLWLLLASPLAGGVEQVVRPRSCQPGFPGRNAGGERETPLLEGNWTRQESKVKTLVFYSRTPSEKSTRFCLWLHGGQEVWFKTQINNYKTRFCFEVLCQQFSLLKSHRFSIHLIEIRINLIVKQNQNWLGTVFLHRGNLSDHNLYFLAVWL